MKLKNYTNEYCIVFKPYDDFIWRTNIEKIQTPQTITFSISTSNSHTIIKKISWDFGNGNQIKTITNRKFDLNNHTIDCKYKKAHDTTINIQASVYTDNKMFITQPITTITVNEVIKEHYVKPDEFKQQIIKYYKSGVFTNEVADSIYKIANRLAFAPNFINYCVDEQTEALTQRGWLKYNEISKNDVILSYDIKTNNLTWSKIEDIFINEKYDGKMHKLTNQGLDALVTPGHRFVTKERGLIQIENIKGKEHLVLMGNPVVDSVEPTYSDEFVELVGWAVTEGNYLKGKKEHSLQIFQKKGPKAEQIRECLEKINIPYKVYEWSNPEILGFRFNKKIANDIIDEIAPDKILSTDFILKLTHKQRLLLIDIMIKGGGWIINRSQNKCTFGYVQKDKKHIDRFLMLCTLCGITTSHEKITKETPFGKTEFYNVYFYENAKHTCSMEHTDLYSVRPGSGEDVRDGKKDNKLTQNYKGVVWCPKTEYGTFVCKRGKYIYVTGNTYREEMVGDAVIRMIEALTSQKFNPHKGNPFSYFTKIAFHAFCNRIKKEKKVRETLANYQNKIYNEMIDNRVIPYKKQPSSVDEVYEDI